MLQLWIARAVEFKSDRRGQDLLEFALIAGFMATAAVAVLSHLSPAEAFNAVTGALAQAISSGISH
jgi:Flp pilus assembly pilin Flp